MITPTRSNWNSPPGVGVALNDGQTYSVGFPIAVPLGQYLHGYRVTARVDGSNWPGMVVVTTDDIGAATGQTFLPVDPFDPATQLEAASGVGDVLVELHMDADTRRITNIATVVLPAGAHVTDLIPSFATPVRLRHLDVLTTAAGGEADVQTSTGTMLWAAPGSGSGLWSRDFGPDGLDIGAAALPLQVATLGAWAQGRAFAQYELAGDALIRSAGKLDAVVPFAVAGPSTVTAFCAVRNNTGQTAPVPGMAWSLHYFLSDHPLTTWG